MGAWGMSSDQQGNLGCTLYAEDVALVYSAGLSALSYRESCVSYLKKAVSYSRPSRASPFAKACVESAMAAKAVTFLMDSFEGSLRQVIVSCYVRALLRMRFREESTVSSGAIVREIPSILRVKDKSVVAGPQRDRAGYIRVTTNAKNGRANNRTFTEHWIPSTNLYEGKRIWPSYRINRPTRDGEPSLFLS